jgi:hypothetical protein
MKLALLYTVWTGDDMVMLERSIKQHEPYVDYIQIWYQCTSNKGEYSSFLDYGAFYNKNFGFIDRVESCHWEPKLNLNTKQNERNKHDMMIQHAKKQGFTHFILCACDHFYTPEQFEYAKKYHTEHPEIDASFTKMRTYYKHENWYLDPIENYSMPFIHKMYETTAIVNTPIYPTRVDPSVKVNTCYHSHEFDTDEIILHHYSMVRKDIEKKLRNAAASIRWTELQILQFISEYQNAKPGDSISYFQGRKIVEI